MSFNGSFLDEILRWVVDEQLDVRQLLQDAVDPRDYYRHLRALWVLSQRKAVDFSDPVYETYLRHPFVCHFPLSQDLVRLLGIPTAGISPIRFDGSLSVAEMCQWVLLKADLGEEVGPSIQKLLPLLSHPALWSTEANYDRSEYIDSVSLLLKRFPAEGMPAVSWQDREFGMWVSKDAAFSLSGSGTSLGSFRKAGVEICALGPQFYPTTDLELFGISGVHAAQSLDEVQISGWTRASGRKDVWLYASARLAEDAYQMQIRWMGITPEKKGAFAFYVKAKSAQVGSLVLRGNCLQRYSDKSEPVIFNDGALQIHSTSPRLMQLIPLAGEGCFWDASFLLLFEANPLDPVDCFIYSPHRESV